MENLTNRAKANFKQFKEHTDKLSAKKYDSSPSVLQKDEVDKESPADRELKHLIQADVFRSADKTIKETNSNDRRYR